MRKFGKPLIVILHIACWAAFFFAVELIFTLKLYHVQTWENRQIRYEFHVDLYKSLLITGIFKIILFYVNSFLLLKNYQRTKNIFTYIIAFVALVAICYGIESIIRYRVNRPFLNNDNDKGPLEYAFKANIVIYTLVIGLSFIYFFLQQWVINERVKHALIEEQLASELKLLKSQIKPHFLFNTLNNLFSIAQSHNDVELSFGIYTLSGIMRYVMYDSNAERVKLDKEINYIEDYIDLANLRFEKEDAVDVLFKVEGDITDKYIAPMLLIPFIENAFKHGINLKKHSLIHIELRVDDSKLNFSITNTNHSYVLKTDDDASGIGLQNVQKRLALLYGNEYDLTINPGSEYYSVQLLLPLTSAS